MSEAMLNETMFDELTQAFEDRGAKAALDQLIVALRDQKQYHQLFDAMILQKRFEMKLPLVPRGKLGDLPESRQKEFEEFYVEACRMVGRLYLEQGDIRHAWLYLSTISEPQIVSEAIEKLAPEEVTDEVIDVAFQQGANLRKGYEFILHRYGTCSSITVFEQLAQADKQVRQHCARLLLQQLHRDLLASLMRDIEKQEGQAPATEKIVELITGRDWLFGEMSYHVDTSHLSSVVRYCRLLEDASDLAMALELTQYGRRLSSHFQFKGEPPFENAYEDYAIYFRALLGQDVNAGVEHFLAKLPAVDSEDTYNVTAEVVVAFLARLGRVEQAMEVSLKYVKHASGTVNGSVDLADLCRQAGDFRSLLQATRQQGDLVNYTAAMLEQSRLKS